MDIKDRIKLLMDSQNLSQQEFAKLLDISPGSLCGILNERTRPTNNHTLAIHNAFPNVSINWLLFGEGDMYLTSDSEKMPPSNSSFFDEQSSTFMNNENTEFTLSSAPIQPSYQSEQRPVFSVPPVEVKTAVPEVIKRQIKEIRVFYDDGTYETFSPS